MGKFKDAFKKGAGVVGDIAKEAAGEGIGKQIGGAAGKKVSEQVFPEDKRGELLLDILTISENNEHLLRRHEEASKNHTENRFVNLLCKIPKEQRRETLKTLNGMEDHEFEQCLDLLENDRFVQFFQRIGHLLNKELKKIDEEAAAGLRGLAAKIRASCEESGMRHEGGETR
jgi:hypothetical protein